MTKKQKEKQEKIEFLNRILNRKTKYSDKQIEMIEGFIFNIITSNTVMNRYESTSYGNIVENETIKLYDCIEYLGNKIRGE